MQQGTQHHGMKLLRKGSRGNEVRELQQKLARLGFDLKSDGIFGDDTEKAVIQLQSMFGYSVDAIVGEGTMRLIDAQIGYGWNVKSPDAHERALASQGKGQAQQKPAPQPGQPGQYGQKPMPQQPTGGQWTPQMPGMSTQAQKPAPQKPAPQKPAPNWPGEQKGGAKKEEKRGGFQIPKAPWPWNR